MKQIIGIFIVGIALCVNGVYSESPAPASVPTPNVNSKDEWHVNCTSTPVDGANVKCKMNNTIDVDCIQRNQNITILNCESVGKTQTYNLSCTTSKTDKQNISYNCVHVHAKGNSPTTLLPNQSTGKPTAAPTSKPTTPETNGAGPLVLSAITLMFALFLCLETGA